MKSVAVKAPKSEGRQRAQEPMLGTLQMVGFSAGITHSSDNVGFQITCMSTSTRI